MPTSTLGKEGRTAGRKAPGVLAGGGHPRPLTTPPSKAARFPDKRPPPGRGGGENELIPNGADRGGPPARGAVGPGGTKRGGRQSATGGCPLPTLRRRGHRLGACPPPSGLPSPLRPATPSPAR